MEINHKKIIPNVLCIGFAKCGTTTLYNIFKQHKDIYLSNIKEPLFWGNQTLENRGFDWYIDRYYSFANKDVIMEINPIIGKYKSAETIKSNYGENTKIIIMLRNPIQRLYSNFRMNLIDGTSFKNIGDNLISNAALSFQKWLFEEYISDYNEDIKFIESPRMYRNGNYYNVVKDYLSVFKKENVKIIFFEDFISNTEATCKDIMHFIGIEKDDSINYNIRSNDGNRMPINEMSIMTVSFIITKLIYNLEINPLIKSEKYDCLVNNLSWELFNVFSKYVDNPPMTELSYDILSLYYNEMIALLGQELNINLYDKWNITSDRQQIIRRVKKY